MEITHDLKEEIKFLQNNKHFLGREFLTWLWFKTETTAKTIKHNDYGKFELIVDDKIVLSSNSSTVKENSLKGGTPAFSKEAGNALLSGKMAQELRFILQNQESQWFFTLNANDLNVKNLKCPHIPAEDSTSYFIQRISLIRLVNDLVDTLLKEYLVLKMSAQLEQEIENLQDWMTSKAGVKVLK